MNGEEFSATLKTYSDSTMRKIIDTLNLPKNINNQKALFAEMCEMIASRATEEEILTKLNIQEE